MATGQRTGYRLDLTGQRFGRWVVTGPAELPGWWVCHCDCGTVAPRKGKNLKNSAASGSGSCGCLLRERAAEIAAATAEANGGHAANFVDITGERFGRWTVLRVGGRRGKRRFWVCRCECGVEKEIEGTCLRAGGSLSCGCLIRDRNRELKTVHGHLQGEAGKRTVGRGSKEWRAWNAMIRRCTYPSMEDYPRYGGRGITVCEKWRHDFAAFLADVGPAPSPKHTLERKDANGHYEPGNVVWATTKEQARNTRRNRLLTHDGKTLCVADWAEATGIPSATIRARLRYGWSVADALTVSLADGRSHGWNLKRNDD